MNSADQARFAAWWASVGQTIGEVAARLAWQERSKEVEALRTALARISLIQNDNTTPAHDRAHHMGRIAHAALNENA